MPASKYLQPVKRAEADSLPTPPAKCGVRDCTEDTAILIAACRVGDSPVLHGTIGKDKQGHRIFYRKVKIGWSDTQDFSFLYWIARCDDCYERETRKAA